MNCMSIDDMISHHDWVFRRCATEFKDLSPQQIEKLMADRNHYVRTMLCYNPLLTVEQLKKLELDVHGEVSQAAQKNLKKLLDTMANK